jgi:hypothetical protein
MLMSDADSQSLPGLPEPTAPQDAMSELTGYIVNRLFSVGLSLESARDIAGNGPAGDRIAAATDEVDRLIRDIRTAMFGIPADRPALVKERMARTARALQATALNAAALLERQADRARPPALPDYPAEIKRWRAFADRAEQMAKRWEQRP